MSTGNIKIIVTLGPATNSEKVLHQIKSRGVDFVRVNMSHSSIDDLKYFVGLAKKVDIPFIIDTEGSQVRTGELSKNFVTIEENHAVKIYNKPVIGNEEKISLKPGHVVNELECGDLLHVDFAALTLQVCDTSTLASGYITAKAITPGKLGRNKAVVVDPGFKNKINLPTLSDKDAQSIKLGLQEKVKHIAASFMRNGSAVDYVRNKTGNKMKIISKIECLEALDNLDDIITKSDYLLLDRGDLSKEIPIEKIPLVQKIIINRARKFGKEVFVATNFLESMVYNRRPTRAEVNDIVNTILDGAGGLALSAETAIGKYPLESINMLKNVVREATTLDNMEETHQLREKIVQKLEEEKYLSAAAESTSLIAPHGGKLVNRMIQKIPNQDYLNSLEKIFLNQNLQMDIEQIAVGTFSPLEGFMNSQDLQGVLDNMRLADGTVWTIPIILDINPQQNDRIRVGDEIALVNELGDTIATMLVEDKYRLNKKDFALKVYGTNDPRHPGVSHLNTLHEHLLGGKINLIKRRPSVFKEHELTPRQVRKLFSERGWNRVVGFHTRNVIHRSHEFIQLKALEQSGCDGLFVQPVIGKKKTGDFQSTFIVRSYMKMIEDFYPKNKVVFTTLATFSRYAGPREAIFTALCRKNFGCSHFIVGRDHTGVGDFYQPRASHEIFDQFSDLGIKPIRFGKVFFSPQRGGYVHEDENPGAVEETAMHISGTQARAMFKKGETPPDWFMRPEISDIILQAAKNGEDVFVKDNKATPVIWFTGLSGSGKTTIANELKRVLQINGKSITIIDGDEIRNNKHLHLGFGREDVRKNNIVIANMAKEKAKDYDLVLVSVISPYQEDRDAVRSIIGDNIHIVYVNTDINTCIKRDVKGLYARALGGEINNFIGISPSNPYEVPINPDIEIKTEGIRLEDNVNEIIDYLTAGNKL